jgi:hypothetical protein
MIKAQFSLASISLILGFQRLVPILIMGLGGQFADRLNPRLVVLTSELLAGICSIGLLILWNGAQTAYWPFLAICVLRSFMMTFQLGSKAKLSKLMSDGEYKSNSHHAIWLMKATQGATLFGGAIAYLFITKLDLKSAIVFDFITFAVSGLCIYQLPNPKQVLDSAITNSLAWQKKFLDLFHFNKTAAALDIFLALSLFGWASFTARLAGNDQSWNALFVASYGLAVWVAGFLERGLAKKWSSLPFWLIMATAYLGLSVVNGPQLSTLLVVFIRDISYWIILHRISGHIQHDSPSGLFGGISSARFTIMVIILSLGEIVVGAWSKSVSLMLDCNLRMLVALLVAIYLFFVKTSEVKKDDRPAL